MTHGKQDSSPHGDYQFNAPACLQRYMDHILTPLIYKQPQQVTVYMDDIGSFAQDKEDVVKLNRQILKILGGVGLYCKSSKCDFHKDEIELLGVTVNGKGFGLEEKKVTDVRNWPVPKNIKQLKGFIGFCNFYCQFLKNFSIVARPLHELDKKGVTWKWEKTQQDAFDALKDLILSEPCLAHADLDKSFRMQMDTLAYAYGAALSQKQQDGKYHQWHLCQSQCYLQNETMTPMIGRHWASLNHYNIGDTGYKGPKSQLRLLQTIRISCQASIILQHLANDICDGWRALRDSIVFTTIHLEPRILWQIS